MPAGPCTGARWRKLPTGHPSRLRAGAQVPGRCSVALGRSGYSRPGRPSLLLGSFDLTQSRREGYRVAPRPAVPSGKAPWQWPGTGNVDGHPRHSQDLKSAPVDGEPRNGSLADRDSPPCRGTQYRASSQASCPSSRTRPRLRCRPKPSSGDASWPWPRPGPAPRFVHPRSRSRGRRGPSTDQRCRVGYARRGNRQPSGKTKPAWNATNLVRSSPDCSFRPR